MSSLQLSIKVCLFVSFPFLGYTQTDKHYLLLMTTSSAPVKDMFTSRIMLDSAIFCSSRSEFTRLIPSFKLTDHESSVKVDYESCLQQNSDVSPDYSLVKHKVDNVESLVIEHDTCFYLGLTNKEYQEASISSLTAIEIYHKLYSNVKTVYSDSTKMICGYKCSYGRLLSGDSGQLLLSFWYAPQLGGFSSPLSSIAGCSKFIMSIHLDSFKAISVQNSETGQSENIDLSQSNTITINRLNIIDHFIVPLDKYKFEKVDKDGYMDRLTSVANKKWVRETIFN